MRQLVVAALLASSAPAAANGNDDFGVQVGAIDVRPRDGIAGAYGLRAELAYLPLTEVDLQDCPAGCILITHHVDLYLDLGAFATHAAADAGATRRDLFGARASIGVAASPFQTIVPYAAIGLDALHVDTTLPAGDEHRGFTLGADLRAGVLAYLGKRVVASITASYLGAVAPGTGDNAGGLFVEAALGWRLGWGQQPASSP